MNTKPVLIYVMSPAHSGSTLLELLISAHSSAVSSGPMKVFSSEKDPKLRQKSMRKPCTCGAPTKADCPFWSGVDAALRDTLGLGLWEIDTAHPDPNEFVRHNRALLEAIMLVSGCRYIVESSKSVRRLARLIECEAFDVRPVHLIRGPQGVVFSHLKDGAPWLYTAFKYNVRTQAIRKVLRGREHFLVRYEQLATKPAETLSDLMSWVGLDFEAGQLKWAEREYHTIGGNEMRHTRDSTIRLDEKWRTGLSSFQKKMISLITLPATGKSACWHPVLNGLWRLQVFGRMRRRVTDRRIGRLLDDAPPKGRNNP